jgi:hypothetical protein
MATPRKIRPYNKEYLSVLQRALVWGICIVELKDAKEAQNCRNYLYAYRKSLAVRDYPTYTRLGLCELTMQIRGSTLTIKRRSPSHVPPMDATLPPEDRLNDGSNVR